MSLPNREVFKNNASTTLNGAINNSVTTVTVTDGSVFPSTGNFRVLVDDEIMHVTAVSTNDLTVNRGVESTTAASHSNGATITHIVTQDGLYRAGQDSVFLWGYSGRPALGKLVDGSGNIIDSSDFTVTNANSTTLTDQDGTILVRKPNNSGASENNTFYTVAVTPPMTRIMAFQFRGARTQTIEHLVCGMVIRESSTGKAIVWGKDYNQGTKIAAYRYNSATSFSANSVAPAVIDFPEIIWLKIEIDASLVRYSYSSDGVEWFERATENKTAFIAGAFDQVGFAVNNLQSNDPTIARILHFSPGA